MVPKTVWLENCLNPGHCSWSTSWNQDVVFGVLVGPRTVLLYFMYFSSFQINVEQIRSILKNMVGAKFE